MGKDMDIETPQQIEVEEVESIDDDRFYNRSDSLSK